MAVNSFPGRGGRTNWRTNHFQSKNLEVMVYVCKQIRRNRCLAGAAVFFNLLKNTADWCCHNDKTPRVQFSTFLNVVAV